MDFLSSSMQNASAFFSTNPSVLFIQSLMIAAAAVVVFLVLFATRDILHRTHSFIYQIACIVLVAILPVFGFLIYLLIRPHRTLAERRVERKLDTLLHKLQPQKSKKAEK